MRGPIVYCAEFPKSDLGKNVWNSGFFFPENITLVPEKGKSTSESVIVLKGKAMTTQEKEKVAKKPAFAIDSIGWENLLYRKLSTAGIKSTKAGSVDFTLIPYYTWANRGPSYMTVWIPLAK